jgi:hypothetical protein
LYGSKQGTLKWYKHLSGKLTKCNWGVFIAHIGNNLLILAVHVNNCTITSSSKELIKVFKVEITSRFKTTDLGPIS